MSDNNTQIYEDEMDFASPNHMRRTLRRLWVSVNDQHKRLIVVLVSVVFYTLLSVAAPFTVRTSWICCGTASRRPWQAGKPSG